MKAKEVLRLYASGRRDFRGVNLAGQSFKRENLAAVDFSQADIRGCSFDHASLRAAKFRQATAGMRTYRIAMLLIGSWIVSGISGICSSFASFFALALFRDSSIAQAITGVTLLVVFIVLLFFTVKRGVIAGIIVIVLACAITALGFLALSAADASDFSTVIFAVAIAVASIGAGVIAVAVSVAVVGSVAVSIAQVTAVGIAIIGAFTGSAASTMMVPRLFNVSETLVGVDGVPAALVFVGALGIVLFGAYKGWHIMRTTTEKYVKSPSLTQQLAYLLVTTGGTSFRKADLTDADFTEAQLKNTDFRTAKLGGTTIPQGYRNTKVQWNKFARKKPRKKAESAES